MKGFATTCLHVHGIFSEQIHLSAVFLDVPSPEGLGMCNYTCHRDTFLGAQQCGLHSAMFPLPDRLVLLKLCSLPGRLALAQTGLLRGRQGRQQA